MLKITVLAGPDASQVFTPSGDTVVIGRGDICDLVLRDNAVSRRHCTLQREGDHFLLADLQSANGTFLNDLKTRIDSHVLRNGDEIVVGKSRLRVEFSPQTKEASATALREPIETGRPAEQSPTLVAPLLPPAPQPAKERLGVVRQPDVPIVVTVVSGPDRGMVYAPAAAAFSIGRTETCAIVLHDERVSHLHATIRREAGRYRLYDENSHNGTFLRGPAARIFHADLADGDILYLGETQLRIEIASANPAGQALREASSISGVVDGRDLTLTLTMPARRAEAIQAEDVTAVAPVAVADEAEEVTRVSPPERARPHVILQVIEGKDAGVRFEPPPGAHPFSVGRGKEADFRLQDKAVSRIHFMVRPTAAGWELVDNDSLNGTFVDQRPERVERLELKGGEEIRVSETRLKVEFAQAEDATVLASPSRSPAVTEKPRETPAPVEAARPQPLLAASATPHVQSAKEDLHSRSAAFKERLAKIAKFKGVNLRPLSLPGSPRQWAVLSLMLMAVASCYGFILLGKPAFFSSGPVSTSHAEGERACATCHPAWGIRPMNSTCITAGCHATVVTAIKGKEDARDDCIACHTEHRGRTFNIKGGEALCWNCHETGFRQRPLRAYYEKVFVAAEPSAAKSVKEESRLRIRPPSTGEEHRAWQQSLPHIESGLIFAHAAHELDSRKSACEICHKTLPEGAINGAPSHAECIDCHDEVVDRDPKVARAKASEECLKCHTHKDGGITRVQRVITYVRFSHDDHEATECVQCHFAVSGEQDYRPVLRSAVRYPLPMDACYTCHEQKQATTACLDCHRVHHNFPYESQVAWGWLRAVTLGKVLLVLLTMVAGAGAYIYGDMRLARQWLEKSPSPLPAAPVGPPTPTVPSLPSATVTPPAAAEGSVLPFPLVDASTCIACGSCIDSCPTSVLAKDPATHKSTVVNPTACKALEGCTICQDGCPTGAIRVTTAPLIRTAERPQIDAHYESNIAGLFLVGEVVGAALIKKAVNQGDQVVRYIAEKKPRVAEVPYDVIIVGAGPAGLGAALHAKKLGLHYLLLERETLASTIQHYPRDKAVLAEPVALPLYGMLPVMEAEKETLIAVWQAVVQTTGLEVHEHEQVTAITKTNETFTVTTRRGMFAGASVILAIGTRGDPRTLGVGGEDLAKVSYSLSDAAEWKGKKILVVGGGDSAIEAAIALAKESSTTVTLAYRGAALTRAKSRNVQALTEQEKAGRVTVLFNSHLIEITPQKVTCRVKEEQRELENDAVFILIGADAPKAWLEQMGINIVTVQETVGPQW